MEDRVYFPAMSAICLQHQQIMPEAATTILVLQREADLVFTENGMQILDLR